MQTQCPSSFQLTITGDAAFVLNSWECSFLLPQREVGYLNVSMTTLLLPHFVLLPRSLVNTDLNIVPAAMSTHSHSLLIKRLEPRSFCDSMAKTLTQQINAYTQTVCVLMTCCEYLLWHRLLSCGLCICVCVCNFHITQHCQWWGVSQCPASQGCEKPQDGNLVIRRPETTKHSMRTNTSTKNKRSHP